jgi:sugar/nucleoside kinase (ribokinase family)
VGSKLSGDGPRPGADLVVVGDCNPDVLVLGEDVTPSFGQREKLVDSVSLVVGGSAAITAVAAARLGVRVALVAAVGDDPAGGFLLGQLARGGVDTAGVAVRADTPTGMTVALSRGEDRAILTAAGAVASLTARDVPAALLARARHLHVSSYFLLEESLGPGLAALFAQAHAAGVRTSLDTNWDPAERWGGDRLREVLAHTDLLLPNEAEALHLSGAATLRDAVGVLTAGGAQVAIKLGAQGALCADGTRQYCATPPPATPVDTTGAGDCFNAGLLAGLLRGLDFPSAVALGCAVGTASTAAPGGTRGCPDMPTALALAETVVVSPTAPEPSVGA